jgi:hypothetical protein
MRETPSSWVFDGANILNPAASDVVGLQLSLELLLQE